MSHYTKKMQDICFKLIIIKLLQNISRKMMLIIHMTHLPSVSTSSLNISKSQSRLLSSISVISCGPRKFFTCMRKLAGLVIALIVDSLAESDDDLLDSHAVRGDC